MTEPRVLCDLVPRQARHAPDHPAYTTGRETLSYGALDRRTRQVAALLQSRGAQKGDLVAICMPNCIETAIAVHGIMRAGTAHVPVDPGAPPARMAQILQSGGIRHILAHPSVASALGEALRLCPPMNTIVGMGVDGDPHVSWDALAGLPDTPAPPDVGPEDVAYVMFTSGSTGVPKGIIHTHASGLAYARASAELYGYVPGDVIAATGPLHFDISTMTYLACPYAGATGAIIPPALTKLPASLTQFMQDVRLSVLYTVPQILIQMMDGGALATRDLGALRWVKFCGELFPPKSLEAVMAQFPQARFSNSYGPSEVNQCTYCHMPENFRADQIDGQVPIGIPFGDTRCLLLDGDRPVADGETGELLVATSTMMAGYWQNDALNARAFFTDPATGLRYFRTRDAVFVDPQGQMVMVGRYDRMVKMRGYRLELDEIEFHLLKHPAVREVAVYPITRGSLVMDIAANILLDTAEVGPSEEPAREIRAFARQCLPAYAIPRFLSIDTDLPRTASGKIDRKTLQSRAEREMGLI